MLWKELLWFSSVSCSFVKCIEITLTPGHREVKSYLIHIHTHTGADVPETHMG